MIAGVIRGAIYLPQPAGNLGEECAHWPDRKEDSSVLASVAARALAAGAGELHTQVHYGESTGQICDVLACPIFHEDKQVAVIAVMLASRSAPQQRGVLQLLQWSTSWFSTMLARAGNDRSRHAPVLMELVAQALGAPDAKSVANTVVDILVQRTSATRVSLAQWHRGHLKLSAISGLRDFDSRTQLTRALTDAMEEAADQQVAVQYPAPGDAPDLIRRAHGRLAAMVPGHSFFTVSSGDGAARAALIFEHAEDRDPSDADRALYTDVITVFGRIQALQRAANRPFASAMVRARGENAGGGRRWRRYTWALAAAALLGAAALIPAPHRITADAGVVGFEQRAIVAPISGFVASTSVRPGDDVQTGDLLARLDTRELQLELDSRRSQRAARQAEYQDALARRDRTEVSVLRARLQQIDAEMELVSGQIERAELRAPYAGVVVSGDLSQALAAPVEVGQVLFEIAPLAGYRVVLEVDEHDVATVTDGHSGKLRLAALPGQALPFTVDRVLPVAVSGDGHSYFRVEGRLESQPPQLRPGMRGVAKVTVDRRSVLWLWTHAFVDRVRLLIWRLGF